MIDRFPMLIRSAALAAALALAACSGSEEDELAQLDSQLTNDTDPALTSALEDQILVDPSLQQQANRNVVRPPETPAQAQYPLPQPAGVGDDGPGEGVGETEESAARPRIQPAAAGQGAFAGARSTLGADSGTPCGGDFNHDASWAKRLPAAFPLFPGARITEAAGNRDCRVVTFATKSDWQRVLDWYHTRAVRSGYSSEHQIREGDHVLAGVHGRGGAAFYLIVTPTRTGSDVALIASKG